MFCCVFFQTLSLTANAESDFRERIFFFFSAGSQPKNKASASKIALSLVRDWVQVKGEAVQSGWAVWNCHDAPLLSPCYRFVWCAAGVCTSIPQRGGSKWREGKGGEEKFEKKWRQALQTTPILCIHLRCVTVCVSVLALQFVCGAHTQLMTYPKPRPARIPFESQVWRVQLRCTNAA